jgi:hypothetical protein
MALHYRFLVLISIIVGTISFFLILPHRESLFYLTLISIIVLPLSFWRQYRFKLLALSSASLAILLAATPIDIATLQTDHFGIHLQKAHYGYARPPGMHSYGCIVPAWPVRYVMVITH